VGRLLDRFCALQYGIWHATLQRKKYPALRIGSMCMRRKACWIENRDFSTRYAGGTD
jgi:hypothetical protein